MNIADSKVTERLVIVTVHCVCSMYVCSIFDYNLAAILNFKNISDLHFCQELLGFEISIFI